MEKDTITAVKIDGREVWKCEEIAKKADKTNIILLTRNKSQVVNKTSLAFVMTLFVIFLSSYINKR